MFNVVILGAGISGLATGWFLKELLGSQLKLTIIEKNQRAGGWIETSHSEGFLFEQGPRSCRTKGVGQETLALIEALGLEKQVITPHPQAQKRFIYRDKKLQQLPKHLWQVPFNSLTKGWLKALWSDYQSPKRVEEDESIHSFFSRRIGTSLTENLIDPLVSGIYAGDCSRLSIKSCFPLFDAWEQKQGSLVRGAWRHPPHAFKQTPFTQKMSQFPMFSFREGMETLPRALTSNLKDSLLLGQSAKSLRFENQKITIELSQGESLSADYLISTLPTFALSSLLTGYPPLVAKLDTLSYATTTSINVGFNRSVLPYQGFGYLIPSRYKLPVLGCVWDSAVFPQQNQGDQTRLTVMMGGSRHPEVEQMSRSQLVDLTHGVLKDHMGIRELPAVIQIKQAKQAIPQFEVGYAVWKKEVQEMSQRLCPQLILSGSSWSGVAINECVAFARQTAQNVAARIIN